MNKFLGGGCLALGLATGALVQGWPGWCAVLVLTMAGSWMFTRLEQPVAVRLGGLRWTIRDLCRGFFITGDIGSGKTSSALTTLLWQVFQNVPTFGGVCIDEKGVFGETLSQMAAQFGRADDVIILEMRPESASADWKPRHRFNLVGDRTIPAATYARMIFDAALTLGHDREQTFFLAQAELHIARALEALALLDYEVNLENVCELLTQESELAKAVKDLRKLDSTEASRLADHFEHQLLRSPPEQRGGVVSTILNFLRHFTEPDVAEVFCRDSTFTLADLDAGKILCLLIPHRHQGVRRYCGVMLKGLVYLHVLCRFNLPAEERTVKNLLIVLVDEAQRFVTSSKSGQGEAAVVDLVREANCAVIMATQSITSVVAALGKDAAQVLALNLRNRIIFRAADQEDAEEAAGRLGKRPKSKVTRSYGRNGSQRNVSKEDEFVVSPHSLRRLRQHQCLIIHCRGAFKKRVLPPRQANGKVARWWRNWS